MQPVHPSPGTLALAVLALSLAGFATLGCGGGPQRRALGEPVDVAAARPLADLLESYPSAGEDAPVVVRGEIGEVCATSGCWFALRDVKGDKAYELLIDLKGSADFTVPRSVRGRSAIVQGTIVGERPDLKMMAVGLVLEADENR